MSNKSSFLKAPSLMAFFKKSNLLGSSVMMVAKLVEYLAGGSLTLMEDTFKGKALITLNKWAWVTDFLMFLIKMYFLSLFFSASSCNSFLVFYQAMYPNWNSSSLLMASKAFSASSDFSKQTKAKGFPNSSFTNTLWDKMDPKGDNFSLMYSSTSGVCSAVNFSAL